MKCSKSVLIGESVLIPHLSMQVQFICNIPPGSATRIPYVESRTSTEEPFVVQSHPYIESDVDRSATVAVKKTVKKTGGG